MKTHRNVTPRQEALAERNLCTAVAALQSADECRAFFRDLCTPAELQAMADRWAVVDWLQRGLPYREIHRITGVSVTTIGRVARFLGNGNGGYEVAGRRLEDAKRTQASRRSEPAENAAESGKRAQGTRRPEATRHG
jgi:TrpR-related protein YerC/YecD